MSDRGKSREQLEQELRQARQALKELRQDSSNRKESLRQSEERFQTLAEAIDAVVWTAHAPAGRPLGEASVLYINPAVQRLTGLPVEAFLGHNDKWFSLIHPDDLPRFERTLEGLKSQNSMECEYRLLRPDGGVRWVFDRTWVVKADQREGTHIGGLISDFTERHLANEALKEKDRQIRQAQKLEAVGLLAGGVAHEYNNILQVIQGYTHLSMQEVAAHPKVFRFLQRVLKAVDRAAGLTEQLLSFSRRQTMSLAYLSPNKVLADHLKMIKPLIGEHIQVQVTQGADVGTIYADAGQMQQVLLNLCLNARDAMTEGGTLCFSTAEVTFDEDHPPPAPELALGPHAHLQVSDSGCGMTEEVRCQIFDPFFTTKEVGQGTGLGLATAYGIVKQHEGTILVQSAPGEGTTFNIYLPIHERHAEVTSESPIIGGEGGSEVILVAEDEPMILDLAVLILRDAGYRTYTARDGAEALRLFKEHHEEIALALLDVVMPKVSGRAVYEQMQLIQPGSLAIFCTGYDPKVSEVSALLADGRALIRKPFTPHDLLTAVREALDA